MADKADTNWILLRGMTRESGHWGDFVPQLKLALPNARIYPLDLPGTGLYYKAKSPASVPAITAQIRQHALSNGWLEAPVNLFGVSLGGMVALDWIQTYPEEIRAGVLINISLGGLNSAFQRLRWQSLPALLKIMLQTKVCQRELGIIKLISHRKENYLSLAEAWHHIQSKHPVSARNALSQLIAAARFRASGIKPDMPVLLLNSEGDRLVAPGCTAAISQQWHLPCKTHPWAGHDLTTDDGEWVLQQVLNWLDTVN